VKAGSGMSRKSRYGFEVSGGYEALDRMFPLIQAAQRANAVGVAMLPMGLMEQPWFDLTQGLREMAKQRQDLFNNDFWRDIVEVTKGVPGPPILPPWAYNHRPLGMELRLLEDSLRPDMQSMNLGFGIAVKTMQDLAINLSSVEQAIQENLQVFRDIDWSTLIEPEDLEELELDDLLNDMDIDLNDYISLQQRIAGFANRIKAKYPVVYLLLLFLVLSPIQSAYNDAVSNLIRGTTASSLQQTVSKDYKVIEKNIKIDVNNVLNVSIELRDIKDELLKRYGYVSTDQLIVRQHNRVKSKALHTLEFGQVVEIIRKNRNWTLVEHEGDEGLIRGWVFTRYISSFKK